MRSATVLAVTVPPTEPSGEDARHQRLTALFEQALELDADARRRFLDALDDASLRDELASLLELDEEDGPFLEPAVGLAAQFQPPQREKGDRIGNYEIERTLGSGGAGDVYLAHQLRPKRLVAIKVMRQGLVDPARVAKFEFEAQLLARLKHAGIAQVFEAGMFEDRGRKMPFFVMEYVERAKSLTAFAESEGLSLDARLQLFASVCEAVAHGHQHGIAHCDLKPENVLVSPSGDAKVIDFGIARASDHDPNVTTLQTGIYQLAGTLPYMSPEQASGTAAIDVRTDVYSLGAMLFELLTNTLPIDVAGISIPKAAHRIATASPVPLGSFGSQLRGDVETIVAKCLEKEPDRRYVDAGALGADIRRFLANETIEARRPTVIYQLRKFSRRHRGLVIGSTLALLALIAGSAVAVQQAILATQGEARSRWIAYRASISAAGAALATHDVGQARVNLESAPPEHHNWEWRHLMTRLDDSVFAFAIEGTGMLETPHFADRDGRRTVSVRRGEHRFTFDLVSGERLEKVAVAARPRDEESGIEAFLRDRELVIEKHGEVVRRQRLDEDSSESNRPDEKGLEALGFGKFRTRVVVAPGGRFVALHHAAAAARLDLETDTWQTATVDASDTGVTTAAIARDGHMAFAAGIAGRAALWRVDRDQLEPVEQTFGPARSVAFHPSRPLLAVGLQDTTIGIWDIPSGDRIVRGDGHNHAVTAVGFSPDGEFLYSGGLDRTVRTWRAPKLAPLSVKHGHVRGVRQIVTDPQTGLVATTSEDGELRIWDGAQPFNHGVLRQHDGFVFPVAFSADGKWLASAGNDRTVRLWSVAGHQLIATIPSPLGATVDLGFNRSGTRLLAASRSSLIAWDLEQGKRLAAHAFMPLFVGSVKNAAWAEDDTTILVPQHHADGSLPTWNVQTAVVGKTPLAQLQQTNSLCLSDDRRFAVLTDARPNQGHVTRADSDSGSALVVVAFASGKTRNVPPISGSFAWIAGTSMLAARCADDHSRILIWDAESEQVLVEIDGHSDRIYSMCSSPDGTRLCTSGRDGVRLWAVGTLAHERGHLGNRIVELQGHSSFVWSARWQPDGDYVATGSGDGTVRLWGVDSALEAGRHRYEFDAQDERRLDGALTQHGDPAAVCTWLRQGGDGMPLEQRQQLRALLLSRHTWK